MATFYLAVAVFFTALVYLVTTLDDD